MMSFSQKQKSFFLGVFFLVLLFSFFSITSDTLFAANQGSNSAPGLTVADVQAQAGTVNNSDHSGIAWAFNSLLNVILIVVGWFVSIAITLFGWVIDPAYISGPTGFLNRDVIKLVWGMVRDFFNLFFIFILLFSAFGTIFQIDKFSVKKLWFNIVLMALLVNFSFPVTRVIIDAANVPMYFFVNQFGTVGGGEKNPMRGVGTILQASQIQGVLLAPLERRDVLWKSDWGNTPYLIMSIIFVFIFGMVLLVMAMMLVVRLITLTILLMFSPIGFVGSLIPGMNFAGQWWSSLIKNAFYGPAQALLLLVSLNLMSTFAQNDGVFGTVKNVAVDNTSSPGIGDLIAKVAFFSIPVILLWFTITLPSKFGMYGAATAIDWAKKGGKWFTKVATGGPVIPFLERKYEKKMTEGNSMFGQYGKYLAPRAVYKGIKDRIEEQLHEDQKPIDTAAAGIQDNLNAFMSRFTGAHGENLYRPWKWFKPGLEHTNHLLEAVARQKSEAQKKISEVSTRSEHVVTESLNGIDSHKVDQLDGALTLLAKDNNLNDFLTDPDVLARYADREYTDAEGKKYRLDRDEQNRVTVTPQNMATVLKAAFEDAGEKNADVLTQRLMILGDAATSAGNFAFGGMVGYDRELNGGQGGFKINTEEEMAAWAVGKVKNLESQARQRMIHPNSIFAQTADGYGDLNGPVGEAILKTFTGGDVTELRRSRDDLKDAMYNAFKNMEEDEKHKDDPTYKPRSTKFKAAYDDPKNGIFKDYVTAVVKIKEHQEDKGDDKEKVEKAEKASGDKQMRETLERLAKALEDKNK